MTMTAFATASPLKGAGPTPGRLIKLSLSPRTFWLGWALLLLLASLCVFQASSVVLRAVGGVILFGVLPGTALIGALFKADEISILERVSFGLGTSIVMSTLATWIYSMIPGRMYAGGLVAILDTVSIAVAVIAVVRWRQDSSSLALEVSVWTAAAIGLIALTALISFLWLDYAEFEADEIVITNDAFAMVMGDKSAIYRLAKGPAQTLLVAQFELFGATQAEGFLRVPFAAVGVATACAWLLLSRRLLGRWLGLFALLWFALDGLLMSKTRWIQYTILTYLIDILAIYALLMAYTVTTAGRRLIYQLLAGAFAGFGLFSHYTVAFVAPALLLIWLAGEARALRRRETWLRAVATAAVALFISAPFYGLLFSQAPVAGKIGSYYLGYRIGQGPFNSIPWFASFMRMYESPSWFIAASVGALACIAIVVYRTWRSQALVALLLATALAGMLFSMLSPHSELVGYNPSFVPWAALGLGLCLTRAITPVHRALAIWALVSFFIPIFWMQIPSDHFSAFILPATLLSLMSMRALLGSAMHAWPLLSQPVVRAAMSAVVGLIVMLGAGYLFLVILSHTPEYATLYPAQLPPALAWFAADAPPDTKYATPHNNGWRTVAVLYDQGILRGEYQTNEFVPISEWYRAVIWRPPAPQPRYYFAVVHPQVPLLASDVPADLPQTHVQIGQVTVNGELRILIYQRREGKLPPALRTFSTETYDAEWRALVNTDRFIAYRERHRDDTAFYSIAHFLEANSRNSDALAFDDDLGRGLLSQFYKGDRPYLLTSQMSGISSFRRVWGVYWASSDRKVERALAENACPAASQWFGNVRLVLNGVATFATPVAMDARFGDAARLESYAFSDTQMHAGDVLCVRLDWNVIAPTAEPLKLFMHLIDTQGKLAAQTDTEPQAGFKPTTEWEAGERIADRVGIALPAQLAPGRYRLIGGLYDSQSGVRESALASNGSRFPDDSIDFGTVTIQ